MMGMLVKAVVCPLRRLRYGSGWDWQYETTSIHSVLLRLPWTRIHVSTGQGINARPTMRGRWNQELMILVRLRKRNYRKSEGRV